MSEDTTNSNTTKKRCYYEVLDIEMSATSADIKKGYRKQAIIWHPDKNYHRIEEATLKFQEIQNAHTVLSDPNERKWYDEHRLDILNGGDGTMNNNDNDDDHLFNVWPYFTSTCFNGFDENNDNNFYSVYNMVFQQINQKEKDGLWGNQDENINTTKAINFTDAPDFGDSETNYYPVVNDFYNYWSSFISKLNFAWVDEHNINDAPNRQIRRLMEKENKKLRETAKKKYQDSIKTLVDYVKKRDKRVIKMQVEERKKIELEKKKKMELDEKRNEEYKVQRQEWLIEERKRFDEEEAERIKQGLDGEVLPIRLADLSESDDDEGHNGGKKRKKKKGKKKMKKSADPFVNLPENTYGADNNNNGPEEITIDDIRLTDDDNDDNQQEIDETNCYICNKKFKSKKQLKNHQDSKVHKKKLAEIEAELEELGEDDDLSLLSNNEDADDYDHDEELSFVDDTNNPSPIEVNSDGDKEEEEYMCDKEKDADDNNSDKDNKSEEKSDSEEDDTPAITTTMFSRAIAFDSSSDEESDKDDSDDDEYVIKYTSNNYNDNNNNNSNQNNKSKKKKKNNKKKGKR